MEADPGKDGNVIKSRCVELALITNKEEDEHVYMQWVKLTLKLIICSFDIFKVNKNTRYFKSYNILFTLSHWIKKLRVCSINKKMLRALFNFFNLEKCKYKLLVIRDSSDQWLHILHIL